VVDAPGVLAQGTATVGHGSWMGYRSPGNRLAGGWFAGGTDEPHVSLARWGCP